ncbi:MAG: radical SAM protein [Desulfobacteraceae bacterium]|nr:radical SAM protein [Desulfobacteraceae bacterium]
MPRDKKPPGSLIYGPVPSRRLGHSLGVDIVSYKTCTYDCIYCQIGRTSRTTLFRRPYIELEEILAELEDRLAEGIKPDYITIGGSGEPCLNSDIGHIIKKAKKLSDIEVAVLTNGSLLWSPEVQKDLMDADLVLPSMDAFDEESFRKINRPHKDISFDKMLAGLVDFRKVYPGRIWLEIFIVRGINDTEEAMAAFEPCVKAVAPDKIHINTSVRPPAEDFAGRVPAQRLEHLASVLGHGAEVIADFKEKACAENEKNMDGEILAMLSRRPCTASDIAAGLCLADEYVARRISELSEAGVLEARESGGRIYYLKKN